MSRPPHALVARLTEYVNPFFILGIRRSSVPRSSRPTPYSDERDGRYHRQRIAYFRDLILSGKKVDPIELDNFCDRSYIYPEPFLVDGHHRLAGAVLARTRTIPVSYCGRTDVLRYLTGKRKRAPQE